MKRLATIRGLVVAVIVLLFGTAASARQFFRVVISVTDQQGAALPGVTVRLQHADGTTRKFVTDGGGRVNIPDLPGGSYRITAEMEGFLAVSGELEVARPGRTSYGDSYRVRVDISSQTKGQRAAPKPPPPPAPPAPPPPPPPSIEETRARKVDVFYATDRQRAPSTAVQYGGGRRLATDALQYGRAVVQVPREHRLGVIERPGIWTLWREDPSRHFVISSIREQAPDAFYGDLHGEIARSQEKQAFVFIHGFNVTFEDAVYRTAQLAYDLQFDGAPILYSWPSEGQVLRYATDQNNCDWTGPHLRTFLEDLARRSGATRIHLIAHSMGNRALANALSGMTRPEGASSPRFGQLILTAPDIDAGVFRQLADAISRLAAHTTLYASSRDRALIASRTYQTYQRAGDTAPEIVVVPGIDTIDVSRLETDFLGHSYFGDQLSVISDIFYLLAGIPTEKRGMLRPVSVPAGRYWVFQR